MSKALAALIFVASCRGSALSEPLFATDAEEKTSTRSANAVSSNRSGLLVQELEACPASLPLNRYCCNPDSQSLDYVCPGGKVCSSCPKGGKCLCPLAENCHGSTAATPCCDPRQPQKCPSKPDIPCQACENGISCQCPFFAEDCPAGGGSCCDPSANQVCPGGTVCQHCPNGHNCLCPRASPTTTDKPATKTTAVTTTGEDPTPAPGTTDAPEDTTTSRSGGQADQGGQAGLITLVVLGVVVVLALGGALVMRFRARQQRAERMEALVAPPDSQQISMPAEQWRSLGSNS